MKELVIRIAKELVDNPDEVSVTEIEGGHTLVYELRVAKTDIGKIIGKRGQNVNAMRTILNAVSGKSRRQILLELIE